MMPRPRPLVPTLTYLSRTKFCASGKICSVAPLPTKGSPFAGSLNTQRPCFRVSSSCTLYEVFGNFAWRNAPPRKRVAQSEKALALRDRECPRPTGLSVDSLLRSNKGNGNGGNSVRKGENFTPPLAGLILFLFRDFSPRRQERPWPHFSIKQSA